MLKSHKDKTTLSKKIAEFLKETLKDYLNHIDFDINMKNTMIVLEVKEVEVRSDLLKKFGIPLELTKGVIKQIKITVNLQSILVDKPLKIEVEGVNVEMKTIYLSRDYKKDYKNFRQRILDEWEKNHKNFLMNLMKKDSFIDNRLIDQFPLMKFEINNVSIVIVDEKVTSSIQRKIALSIEKINSLGYEDNTNDHKKLDTGRVERFVRFLKVSMNIYKEDEEINSDGVFIHPLDLNLKLKFPMKRNPNLKSAAKMDIELIVENPLVLDISISKINFLVNFISYLAKIKKVEKHWMHRPETHPQSHGFNLSTAKEWFIYAFRVVKEELSYRKQETNEFSTLLEKIKNIKQYIKFYKSSHKLVVAPWIDSKDCSEQLKKLEEKMSLDDIIYCREIAFIELVTEGRAFCSSGDIGEGYKPLIHLWEFYVNDLRSKWKSNTDQKKPIRLTEEERRDLMEVAKLDKDKVLLSYLKGEPNNPEDILSIVRIQFNLIIINFSRKLHDRNRDNYKILDIQKPQIDEVDQQLKYYHAIYSQEIKSRLSKLNFITYINQLKETGTLCEIIDEETKLDSGKDPEDSFLENEKEEVPIRKAESIDHRHGSYINTGNSQILKNLSRGFTSKPERQNFYFDFNESNKKPPIRTVDFRPERDSDSGIMINNKINFEDSVDYLDERLPKKTVESDFEVKNNQNLKKSKTINVERVSYSQIPMVQPEILNYEEKLKETTNIKLMTRKTMLTILISKLFVHQEIKRNKEESLSVNIENFKFVDHNLTYVEMNKNTESALKTTAKYSHNYKVNLNRTNHVEEVFQKVFRDTMISHRETETDFKLLRHFDIEYLFLRTIAKFLTDILTTDKYRDLILMQDFFVNEMNFIKQYEYKFGFHALQMKLHEEEVIDFYENKIPQFLLDIGLLDTEFQYISEILRDKNKSHALTDKSSFLTKSFVSKVFEKGLENSNSPGICYLKSPKSKYMNEEINSKKSDLIFRMVEDANQIMTSVGTSLIKYIFSSMYPYLLNDEGFKKIFSEAMKGYFEEVNSMKERQKSVTEIFFKNESKLWLFFHREKKGRDYPRFIYEKRESEATKKSDMTERQNLKNGEYVVSEVNVKSEKQNRMEIRFDKKIDIKISNETIAEVICLLPKMNSVFMENSIKGNIISELNKSNLEIYENLRKLKAKWKVMEYLNKKSNKNPDINTSFEMNYMISKANVIKDLMQSKTPMTISIDNFNLKIIDKLYFNTYEDISSISLNLNSFSLENSNLSKVPIKRYFHLENKLENLLENKLENLLDNQEDKESGILSKKNFDFDEILKLYMETEIKIGKINILIDEDHILVHTDLKANIINSNLKDIPFLPDNIVDIKVSKLEVCISPRIVKVINLISNLKYYLKLNEENFDIVDKIVQEKKSKLNDIESYMLSSSITEYSHMKMIKILNKIIEESKKNPLKRRFMSYLANRSESVLFFSVGKYQESFSQDNFPQDVGIIVQFVVNDKFESSHLRGETENMPHINSKHNNSFNGGRNSNKIEENIDEGKFFTIQCPILVYNERRSLFYEERQLWLLDVFTQKETTSQFANMKIQFDPDKQLAFKSFEFLFCNHFVRTIAYFEHNEHHEKTLKDIKFDSPDFPFDTKFDASGKLKLNNCFYQKSFYYEKQKDLSDKIYPKLFDQGELSSHKGSDLRLTVSRISLEIFASNNSEIFAFFKNLKKYEKSKTELNQKKIVIKKNVKEIPKTISRSREPQIGLSLCNAEAFTKIVKKKSAHNAIIELKELELNIFDEQTNSHDNAMIFFVMKEIKYEENINDEIIRNINVMEKLENEFPNERLKLKPILSNFLIKEIKLVLSIPSLIVPETNPEKRIQVLNPDKMRKVFQEVRQQENKIIILQLGDISMSLLREMRSYVVFKVAQAIKLGFVSREGNFVSADIEEEKIEPLIWIPSKEIKILEQDIVLMNLKEETKSKINLSHKELRKAEIEMFKMKLKNAEINPENDFSIKLTIAPISENKTKRHYVDEDILFYQLDKALKIIKSFLAFKQDYKLKVEFNPISVELRGSLFRYIYFSRNLMKKFQKMFEQVNIEEVAYTNLNFEEDESKNKKELKRKKSSIIRLSPLRERTNKTPRRSTTIDNNLFNMKKFSTPSVENSLMNKNIRTLKQMKSLKLPVEKIHDNTTNVITKPLAARGLYEMYNVLELMIPFVTIAFIHCKDDKEFTFSEITLLNNKGEVYLDLEDRRNDRMILEVEDLKWKPSKGIFDSLLVKHKEKKSRVLEFDIKLGERKGCGHNSKEDYKITAILKGANFIMLNKTIKELILFFEVSSECLKENPLEEQKEMLEKIKSQPAIKPVIYIDVVDCLVLFPESSNSSNMMRIEFEQGLIKISKANLVPKICVESKEETLLTIDKKTCFNVKSKDPEKDDLCPHTQIVIHANNAQASFYINKKMDSFFKSDEITLTIRQPQHDSIVMSLRKKIWEEIYKAHVVTYKPSLEIAVDDATLQTSLGKLLSLKLFVDNNIDEKVDVYEDTLSKFDNIELDFHLSSGLGNVNVFKMNENYTEKYIHIDKNLPKQSEWPIDFDPFENNN